MKKILGMILLLLGIIIIGAGIIGSCYLTLYLLLFKGIVDIYNAIASAHSATMFAIGIIKVIFCEIGLFVNSVTIPLGSILMATGIEIKE